MGPKNVNRGFNNQSVLKPSMNGRLAYIREQAARKGLILQRNTFQPGWSILLPNGRSHIAANDSDMFSYITGY